MILRGLGVFATREQVYAEHRSDIRWVVMCHVCHVMLCHVSCQVLCQVCAVQPAESGPRLRLPAGGDHPASGQGRQHHRGRGAGDQSESSMVLPDQSELTWQHSHHLFNQSQVTGEEDDGSLDQTIAAVREVMEETDYFR